MSGRVVPRRTATAWLAGFGPRLASWLLAAVLLIIWQMIGDYVPGMTALFSTPALVAERFAEALGSLDQAAAAALDFVHRAIQWAPRLGSGEGHGPLNHFVDAPE